MHNKCYDLINNKGNLKMRKVTLSLKIIVFLVTLSSANGLHELGHFSSANFPRAELNLAY